MAEKRKRTGRGWRVSITSFNDDYKPRGGDWSDTTTHHFKTKKSAEAFLFGELHEFINTKLYEKRESAGENDKEAQAEIDALEDEFLEAHKQGLQAMLDMADSEEFNNGEFVARKKEWIIKPIEYEPNYRVVKCDCKKRAAADRQARQKQEKKAEDKKQEEEPSKPPVQCSFCQKKLDGEPLATCGAKHPFCGFCSIACAGKLPCPACV